MAQLTLTLTMKSGARIGPGKAALLESVRSSCSISAAARAIGMDYKRAWLLVDSINRAFKNPAVERMADQQMPCAVKHQATLLLRRLAWHEAHIGAADGFADSLRVSHVVLLPFDVGLHVSRRHQSRGMTEGLKFARPMVRRSAGLDTDQTRGQLLEERHDGATPQLAVDDHLASSINAMNLEH
jgi:molybdenum-dependent DNA-binding transcriptional regulator ModE